jgi:hypothetical protein
MKSVLSVVNFASIRSGDAGCRTRQGTLTPALSQRERGFDVDHVDVTDGPEAAGAALVELGAPLEN